MAPKKPDSAPSPSRLNSRSAQIFERARKVLPGGTSRQATYASPFPIYVRSGHGARVVDVDGIERIDFNNNYTAAIHGYGHPAIEKVVMEQVRNGTGFSFATEKEVELAEILCARVPSIEKIRFQNSGTECVMWAIKAARAYTGRPKIAKCEGAFHGSYDYAEVSLEPTPDNWGTEDKPASIAYTKGTPQHMLDDVVVFPFNDVPRAKKILEAEKGNLSCVLIDPVANKAGMISATREFLDFLRDFCTRNGVLLICDEVLCFRLGYHGAQGEFGIDPDLTCLAKIIGGGFPIGAVGGRDEFMSVFDPTKGKTKVPQSGTYSGNPVTMAAGAESMRLLTRPVFDRINALGERARQGLRRAIKAAGANAQVTGHGSLFRIHTHERTLSGYRSQYPKPDERQRLAQLCEYLLDHGVIIAPTGMCAVTTPMTEKDIDQFVDTVGQGLTTLKLS